MTAGAFTYEAPPMRVVFDPGRLAELHAEVSELGLRRLLVLTTPNQRTLADHVADLLGNRAAGVFTGARMHVPAEVAAAGRHHAQQVDADGCVAIGGGSTIGLGKAIALETGLPVVAVPTTYSGSEMTPVWGITEAGRKRTGRDPAALPRNVVYDPDLTMALPVPLSGTSGINAIAHAVETLYAPDTSPVIELFAEDGIRCLAAALPAIAADPSDREARSLALRGAWLCVALGSAAPAWGRPRCHCTTSSVTSWAAPSTCRRRRPTSWCSRTWRPSTCPPHRLPTPPCPGHCGLTTRPPPWPISRPRQGHPGHWPSSGCAKPTCPKLSSRFWPSPTRPPTHDDLDALLTAAHSGSRPRPADRA
ncbi:iron-containing alcohol dehydrogenase [Sciscionella marina]|uniref:iron-containing alcohol dehydrogenase n=1 Tax=Sciscionella marina TaxID=508770 RepID=UPI00039CD0E9